MRKILLFLLILSALFISAQSAADSLLALLKSEKNLENIPVLQNQISDAYKHSDPEQMQKFAILALNNAKKYQNPYQQAVAYQNLGTSFLIFGDYDKALRNFDISEKILLKITSGHKKIKETLAKTLGSKGVAHSEQNNYAKALECDFEALKIYEETKNELQISKLYNNIGVIYKSIDDKEKALQYFLKANKISKNKDEATFAASASNIGLIYLYQNRLDNSKKYFDESFGSYQKSENPRALGELYNNYSQYYLSKGQVEDAKANLKNAEKEFLSIDDKFGLSYTYLFLGEIYFNENNLGESLKFANKSLELAKELELTETTMNVEKLLSEIYDKKGDQQQALSHLKNYDIEKEKFDVVRNEQQRLKTELNFQYEKEQLEKRENASRERLKGFFIIALVGVFLLGTFLYYRNREKQKTILLQKQLAEFEHKALHLQMNPHFVFNCLAAISAFVMQNGKDEAVRYLSKFSKLMRLTLEFSKESSITIDKEIEALKNYLELEQLRFNHKFDFKIYKDPEIEDDTTIPSLLLQPYVENAIIHGVVPKEGKGFIDITFQQTEENLICTITDNGVGIERSKMGKANFVNAHKSMAMEISQKRLETLEQLENKKIELDITELEDNEIVLGTQVLIKLPLEFIKHTT
ncbi:tetratricopeptide (TPR) repeat protein [Epilithonimonas hungarica]|uniref:tetratricopeptide repeat protein n=1 Tax=Epilithonimonas hungarica TaxID=454006 RepID=UPI0027873E3C|nr:tetratricopeptide repeat protein [Epilithonimonas hungarica]MDP9957059.1 tetratricopeptide (TPR) repeat protein [Epilithonimonas hungarica]